jgi:flagellar biosynthetic protein FliS
MLELANGLRRDANPELVDQMTSLYGFVYRRLVEANMQRDAAAVEDALKILRHQRETWTLVIEKISTVVDAPEASAMLNADRSTGSAFSVEG